MRSQYFNAASESTSDFSLLSEKLLSGTPHSNRKQKCRLKSPQPCPMPGLTCRQDIANSTKYPERSHFPQP
jgi:hypothetical protein